jgi:hypothetical protein
MQYVYRYFLIEFFEIMNKKKFIDFCHLKIQILVKISFKYIQEKRLKIDSCMTTTNVHEGTKMNIFFSCIKSINDFRLHKDFFHRTQNFIRSMMAERGVICGKKVESKLF